MAKKKKETQEYKEISLSATNIFFKNLNSKTEVLVNRGGAGSSKSYSLMQLFVYKFLTEKNKKFLIVRKALPSLKLSVLLDLYTILGPKGFNVRDKIKENKVDMNFYYGTNLLHLGSVDDPEKYRSTDWNYIWMEEATNFTYEDYILLRSRLRASTEKDSPNKMFLSFNPIDELHWIKTELLEKHKDVEEIHSTYHDNPFLEASIIKYYENSKDFNYNFYRVHALGEWGRLDDLIYSQWDTVQSMPTDGIEVYGMDFGFNDPSVVVRVIVKDFDAYLEQVIYKTKMTNTEFIQQTKILVHESRRSRPIYADSAEPDRIKEFRLAGFNIKPAQKSIADGIDFVRRFRLHILDSSENIKKEIQGYSYKRDRQNNVIDEPIPGWDHTLDAIRYALYSHFKSLGSYNVFWL